MDPRETPKEILSSYQRIFPGPLDISQVYCTKCCNSCESGEVLDVLVEIERRHWMKEQLYWDFQLLDCDRDNQLSLQDTCLLLQLAQEANITNKTWRDFTRTCVHTANGVTWEALEEWLFGNPLRRLDEEEPPRQMQLKPVATNGCTGTNLHAKDSPVEFSMVELVPAEDCAADSQLTEVKVIPGHLFLNKDGSNEVKDGSSASEQAKDLSTTHHWRREGS
ncbi:uncharacterized protein LOC115479007 [Microcaecilia unicolor]|uniref:Uncharacterized protein LOC115479007 n=1 Tax=Microcaecilia unicolor TaxID=1415580 RepID=A0A6P7YZM7_9AMPH|nr:uncharacterized protein LOC115479007 [Microcaecilia unicolor]